MPCFTSGAESGSHKCATHSYHIIEQHSSPIFTPDWGADEELLLLEGIETYGLGSWSDIAEHIGGGRDKDEVAKHYYDTYIDSPNFPLPALADPNNQTGLDKYTKEELLARKKKRIEAKKAAAKDGVNKNKPTTSGPACHEVTGYMPGRLEFDIEYDNEAEGTVAAMEFDPGDGKNPVTGEYDPETQLKLTVMDIYNSRLNERVRRKRVIFEHGLLEYRKITALEKKRCKDERDLLNKTKPFARMMNKRDYEEFSEGVLHEFQLRQAIKILQEWRTKGVTTMEAGVKYEIDKAQRASMLKAQFGANDRFGPRATKANAQPEHLIQPNIAHLLSTGPPQLPEIELEPKVNGALQPTSGNAQPEKGDKPPPAKKAKLESDLNNILSGINYTPLNLSSEHANDLHLLSEEEQKLCSVLRIKPKPYIAIKEMMMKEALRQGGVLKKKTAREMCRVCTNVLFPLIDRRANKVPD